MSRSLADTPWPPAAVNAAKILPLLGMAVLVPYAVRLVNIEIPAELAAVYGHWTLIDSYCEYKAFLVLGLGLLMAGAVLLLPRAPLPPGERRARLREFAPLAVLATLIVVAALASPYPRTAWLGVPLRREGALVLLAYLATALYARAVLDDSRAVAGFFRVLVPAALPMAVWGLVQALAGFHLFNHQPWRDFTTAPGSINTGRGLAAFGERPPPDVLAAPAAPPAYGGGEAIAGLFNSNYFGTYIAVLLAVGIAWGVDHGLGEIRRRPPRRRILPVAFAILWTATMGMALLVSRNMGGSVGLLTALFATLLVARRPVAAMVRRHKLPAAATAAGAVLVVAGGLLGTGPGRVFLQKIGERWRLARGIPADAEASADSDRTPLRVAALRLEDNVIHLETDAGRLEIVAKSNTSAGLRVFDDAGRPVPISWRKPGDNGWTTGYLPADRYPGAVVRQKRGGDDFLFAVPVPGSGRTLRAFFTVNSRGEVVFKPHPLMNMREVRIPAPAWNPWPGFERFATGRGFFWSRAAALLPGAGWLGHGPDTVAHIFPHEDILGATGGGVNDYVVHKLHNAYLSAWLGGGVLGFAALAFFLTAHFLRLRRALRHWWASPPAADDAAGRVLRAACLTAWAGGFAYLGAVFWTDSTLHFSPVFWPLAGVGWAAANQTRMRNSMAASIKARKSGCGDRGRLRNSGCA